MPNNFVEWLFASLWYYTVLFFKFVLSLLRGLALFVSAIFNRRPFEFPNRKDDLLARSRRSRR